MNIHTSINSIMSEIGAISKEKTNTQQGFKYRGVDDVMNALQPLLCKHKVYIVPEVMNHAREDRQSAKGAQLIYSVCTVKYTIYADDGSSVTAVIVGEGMDSGDKATNKAMSVAFKYACFQVFCIPTEEMNDPDSESPEIAASVKTTPKTTLPSQSTKGANMTPQQAGAIVLNFGKYINTTLKDIWTTDIGYIEYLYKGEKTSPYIKNAISIMKKAVEAKMGASEPASTLEEDEAAYNEEEIGDEELPF